jgi:addiction module antitoxin, relB/dinJ family
LIQFRIGRDLKIDAEDICNQFEIDLSTVLRMCLKQMVIQKGIPFSVHLSNQIYYSFENDINDLKSKDIENNCEKGFGIDLRGINEEVDSIRKENKI